MSIRTRPEGSGSPRPNRRTAAATEAPPSRTSPPSWGQVDKAVPTSRTEAAIREERASASRIRRPNGIFSRTDSPATDAESMSPSSPWNSGRSGSRS